MTIEQQYKEEGILVLPGMAVGAFGSIELPEGGFKKGTQIPDPAILPIVTRSMLNEFPLISPEDVRSRGSPTTMNVSVNAHSLESQS